MHTKAIKGDILKLEKHLHELTELSCKIPTRHSEKNTLISTMLFTAFEHCRGIHSLLKINNFASANTLLRTLVETTIKAIWLRHCANSDHINNIIKQDQWKKVPRLINEIKPHSDYAPTFLNTWQKLKDLFNSFTHGGIENTIRYTGYKNYITPNIDESETIFVIQLVGLFSYIIIHALISLSGRKDFDEKFKKIEDSWLSNMKVACTFMCSEPDLTKPSS